MLLGNFVRWCLTSDVRNDLIVVAGLLGGFEHAGD